MNKLCNPGLTEKQCFDISNASAVMVELVGRRAEGRPQPMILGEWCEGYGIDAEAAATNRMVRTLSSMVRDAGRERTPWAKVEGGDVRDIVISPGPLMAGDNFRAGSKSLDAALLGFANAVLMYQLRVAMPPDEESHFQNWLEMLEAIREGHESSKERIELGLILMWQTRVTPPGADEVMVFYPGGEPEPPPVVE